MQETREYVLHGVKITEEMPPAHYVVVDIYSPHSSVTPWDCYGIQHQKEYGNVLAAAGVQYVCLRTRETKLCPIGTGLGGSVRFGDDMLPGVYRIAVPKSQVNDAEIALSKHKAMVAAWAQDPTQPMPEACRRSFWRD